MTEKVNDTKVLCELFKLGDGTTCSVLSTGLKFERNGSVIHLPPEALFDRLWNSVTKLPVPEAKGKPSGYTIGLADTPIDRTAESKDQYAHIRMALAAELTIQYRAHEGEAWNDTAWTKDTDINALVLKPAECYRLKPITVTRWFWATKNGMVTKHLWSEAEIVNLREQATKQSYTEKLAWSETEFEV
jgi:hypothetical protein